MLRTIAYMHDRAKSATVNRPKSGLLALSENKFQVDHNYKIDNYTVLNNQK